MKTSGPAPRIGPLASLITGRSKLRFRTVLGAATLAFVFSDFLTGCTGETPHKPQLEEVHTFYSPD